MARPQKEINWEQFEQLCGFQCTQSEIAEFLKIHPNTLSDRAKEYYEEDYSTIYKQYSSCGKVSLRRNQFVLSKKNAGMAIWLGKQWLGQKDISKDEVYEIAEDLINAVREIQKDSGSNDTIRPIMEIKQSILDQRPARKENKVHYELGPEGIT